MPTLLQREHIIRIFLGDRAYGIAGMLNDFKESKEWFIELVNEIEECIEKLDTAPGHQRSMLIIVQDLRSAIKSSDQLDVIYKLFLLCCNLLGFGPISSKPIVLRTPIYCQDENQYFTEQIYTHRDFSLAKDKRDIISLRAKVAQQLKNNGISTVKIGKILGISDFKVKQLAKLPISNSSKL